MPFQILDSVDAAHGLKHRKYDRSQLIIFAGKREHGKTYACNAYIDEDEPRVLGLDPFGDFRGLSWPTEDRTSSSEALEDMAYYQRFCRRRICPPFGASSRDWAEDFFVECVDGEHPLTDALLVLDEITLWTLPRESAALQKLVLQGRRLGIRMVVCCQRVSLIPGVFLSECTDLVVFRMTRPRDLDVIDDWASSHHEGRLSDIAPRLDIGECVVVGL